MDIDTKSRAIELIRKRRAMLDHIEDVIANAGPEELALLRDALSLNGTSTPDAASTQLPAARKRGRKASSLVASVREVAADMGTGINVQTVQEALTKSGVRLKSKRPASTINLIFHKMMKQGLLKEVRPGSGRMPSEYAMVQ